MGKTINDLNLEVPDLLASQYSYVLPAGSILYRIVPKEQNPLVPTGRATSWASTAPRFDPQSYARLLCAGSGLLYFAGEIEIAKKEAAPLEGKEVYRITLLKPIQLLDVDKLCLSQGIMKPCRTHREDPKLHEFYGKSIPGTRCESFEEPTGYEIIINHDIFKDFKDYVTLPEKLSDTSGV